MDIIASLNGSETWLVFFDKGNEASQIILEEIKTLVDHTNLYHAKVGRVKIDESPNTVFRLGLSKHKFSIVLFRARLGKLISN